MNCSNIENEARKLAQEVLIEKKSLEEAGKVSTWKPSEKVRENIWELKTKCRHSAPTIHRLYSEAISLEKIFQIINESE